MMEFSFEAIEYRFKQVDNSYLVWLGTLNRYLQLEEPAFWIFQQFAHGISHIEAVSGFSERYHIPESEASRFASEIEHRLTELYRGHHKKYDPLLPDETVPQIFDQYSEKHIRINNKVIRFTFGSRRLEQFIFPLLSHLSCQIQPSGCDVHFDLFEFGEMVSLRLNKRRGYAWPMEQAHKLKGALFLHIINSMYDSCDEDWMGVIHASSVSLDQHALLFPAQPGGGKSTIASLLMAHGCNLVSDDFTPVSAKNGLMYSFPGRVSIKPGSLPLLQSYFPELSDAAADHLHEPGEKITFLTPRHAENHQTGGFSARAIVFVQYDQRMACELVRIDNLSSINDFLNESWLADSALSADHFLDWYFEIPCFRLRYGDHKKAVEALLTLFENEP